jgi:hypothetical protein
MARKKVDFAWWGNTKHLDIPGYCLVDCGSPYSLYPSRCNAIGASIGRRNGMDCCCARVDSYSPEGVVYELTFGRPCKTGGHNVVATLWIRIKKGD